MAQMARDELRRSKDGRLPSARPPRRLGSTQPRARHNIKSGATIRVAADQVRSTRRAMAAEREPKELLNRILQLKQHLSPAREGKAGRRARPGARATRGLG